MTRVPSIALLSALAVLLLWGQVPAVGAGAVALGNAYRRGLRGAGLRRRVTTTVAGGLAIAALGLPLLETPAYATQLPYALALMLGVLVYEFGMWRRLVPGRSPYFRLWVWGIALYVAGGIDIWTGLSVWTHTSGYTGRLCAGITTWLARWTNLTVRLLQGFGTASAVYRQPSAHCWTATLAAGSQTWMPMILQIDFAILGCAAIYLTASGQKARMQWILSRGAPALALFAIVGWDYLIGSTHIRDAHLPALWIPFPRFAVNLPASWTIFSILVVAPPLLALFSAHASPGSQPPASPAPPPSLVPGSDNVPRQPASA